MIIRKARITDWPYYQKLRNESDNEYSKIIKKKPRITERETKKDFFDAIQSKDKTLLLAKENNIIGYLFGTYKENSKIDFLFVKKEHRNQGISKMLINKFSEKATKKLVLEINSNNKTAAKVFEKIGFTTYAKRIMMEKKIE